MSIHFSGIELHFCDGLCLHYNYRLSMGSFMKALGAAVIGQTTSYSLSQVEESNHHNIMCIGLFHHRQILGGI